MKKETFVVIGNGIAGLSAATTIRNINCNCEIILLGDEPHLSYSRPMISKAPLRGFDISKFIIRDKSWYKEQNITTIVNKKVKDIDKKSKSIILEDGKSFIYDKLIIATGAESFIPPINGVHREGVFVARKIDDIFKIRKYKLKSKDAVVIGGGVVGLEIAWELKKSGLEVVILEQGPNLMGRILDNKSSKVLKEIVESFGIKVITNIEIDRLEGKDKVEKVVLKDKSEYKSDLVVLSCGIKPNIDLAKNLGINTNRAIVVNQNMQSSEEDIYACGDCVEFDGVNLGLWQEAINQGEVAGQNACGNNIEYTQIKSSLIFNGINTSLYTIGDIGKNLDLDYEELVIENRDKNVKYFAVNNSVISNYTYEKYYFNNEKIVGGVLIGDLSNMSVLKKSIDENLSKEEFKNLIEN